jgi:hypothetical protein
MEHKFFEILRDNMKKEVWKVHKDYSFPKKKLVDALKISHPIIYDARCTREAIELSASESFEKDNDEVVHSKVDIKAKALAIDEFSLPFLTCMYILTNPQDILIKESVGWGGISASVEKALKLRIHGYLINEISPEIFSVFSIGEYQVGEKVIGHMDYWKLDLNNLERGYEESVLINELTDMISVKRIGIEHRGKVSVRTKGIGVGFTSVRFDNIYHIANKREYEYTTPTTGSSINWDFTGWWKGHWRAFYQKCAITGKTLRDHKGRNAVDYSRKGKNRKGDKEAVNGYMWVREHFRGDKSGEEIKTRHVKHA